MTAREKLLATHPGARVSRDACGWSAYLGPKDREPIAHGATEEAAWCNALRSLDPEDRTPLPGQAELFGDRGAG